MNPQLKLTDSDEDLFLPPDALLKHLESSLANFDTLLADLHCTPEDLHQTISDPQTNELLKLKTQLAALQLKLLAIRYIPHAFGKLVNLMNTSEKPEVARRAAATVLNIAGIATHTAPDLPTPPTPHAHPDPNTPNSQCQETERTPEDEEVLKALGFIFRLKHQGIHLDRIAEAKIPDLINFLTTTLDLQHPPT